MLLVLLLIIIFIQRGNKNATAAIRPEESGNAVAQPQSAPGNYGRRNALCRTCRFRLDE